MYYAVFSQHRLHQAGDSLGAAVNAFEALTSKGEKVVLESAGSLEDLRDIAKKYDVSATIVNNSIYTEEQLVTDLKALALQGKQAMGDVMDNVLAKLSNAGFHHDNAVAFFQDIKNGGQEAVGRAKKLGIQSAAAMGELFTTFGNFLKEVSQK